MIYVSARLEENPTETFFFTNLKTKILKFECRFDLEGQGQEFSNSPRPLDDHSSLKVKFETVQKLSRSQEITQTTTKNNMSP